MAENSWTPENQDAIYPRLSANGTITNDSAASSFWLIDTSYLRLKFLQLGYTIPTNLSQRIGVERLNVYVSGTNLITWSKTRDLFDPEVDQSSSVGNSTARGWYQPQNKTISIGLNMTF